MDRQEHHQGLNIAAICGVMQARRSRAARSAGGQGRGVAMPGNERAAGENFIQASVRAFGCPPTRI